MVLKETHGIYNSTLPVIVVAEIKSYGLVL